MTKKVTRDLVMLHGWAMNPGIWSATALALSAHYQVHNLVLPGYGDGHDADVSDWQHRPPDELVGIWLDELLDRAPDRAVWLGWSLGGQLAILAALKAPEKVESLLLVATTPKFLRSPDWSMGTEQTVLRSFIELFDDDSEKAMTRFLLLQVGAANRSEVKSMRKALSADPHPPRPVLIAGLNVLEFLDLRPQLADLKIPMRVIHGDHDEIIPSGAGRYIAEHVAQGEFLALDTGHAPFVTCPQSFNQAVLSSP